MARIRTIKPEFWVSEQIVECSIETRLLFVGLWNFCDDNGVQPASPKRIKMQIFPADDISPASIDRMLDELSDNGLIKKYVIDETEYLIVTGWSKHQKIDRPSYKYPLPTNDNNSTNIRRQVGGDSPSATPRNGMEGNGINKTIVHSANHSHLEKSPKSTKRTRTATRFADWWNTYPKKIGRKKCEQIWKTRNLDAMADTLIADVETRTRHDAKWRDGYIPNPQTYLNGDRWQDEIDHQKRAPPKGNGSTDWQQVGKDMGITAKPGETMDAYARRLRAAMDANNRH